MNPTKFPNNHSTKTNWELEREWSIPPGQLERALVSSSERIPAKVTKIYRPKFPPIYDDELLSNEY